MALISGPPGGLDPFVEQLLSRPDSRSRFVNQAVEMADRYGLDGFNLDVEISGNSTTGPLYNALVSELSDAMHQKGRSSSSDICCDCDGDGGDYMGIRCQDYAAGPIDSVFTMSTYTNDTAKFGTFVHSAVSRLSAPKYGVGFEYNNVLSRESMSMLVELGIRKVALWCDVPEVYGYDEKDVERWWDAIEWFVAQ